MSDPRRDPPSTKFGGEAQAAQTSTSTGGSAGAAEGTMTPDYEGKDSFLGEDAHVVSGGGAPEPEGDVRGGPAMVIDQGRNPNPSAGGDDLVRSHGQDDDSVRTAEESRSTDDRRP